MTQISVAFEVQTYTAFTQASEAVNRDCNELQCAMKVIDCWICSNFNIYWIPDNRIMGFRDCSIREYTSNSYGGRQASVDGSLV